MTHKLSTLVDKWYKSDDYTNEATISRSETMTYIELLLNKTITKDTLRLLGKISILHLISPYSNDPREPFSIPTSNVGIAGVASTTGSNTINIQSIGLEQKRQMNSWGHLLTRLKSLRSNIVTMQIPLPLVYATTTTHRHPQSQLLTNQSIPLDPTMKHNIQLFRQDQQAVLSTISEWLNSIEQEEKIHTTFLHRTQDQISLHLQLLLTIFTSKVLIEDILMTDFSAFSKGFKFGSNFGSKRSGFFGNFNNEHKIPNSPTYGTIESSTADNDNNINAAAADDDDDDFDNLDGVDIETIIYQIDENAQSNINLSPHNSAYGQQHQDEDGFGGYSIQGSQNMIILNGCVSSAARIVLSTTIHRLSRGNVHIQWRDYTPNEQRDIISNVVDTFFGKQRKKVGQNYQQNYQQNNNNNNDEIAQQENIIEKYLPLALHNYVSKSITDNTTESLEIEGALQSISSFVMIFPFSRQLYSKIIKVCSIYHAQLFKMPSFQRSPNAPHHNQHSSMINSSITRRGSSFGLLSSQTGSDNMKNSQNNQQSNFHFSDSQVTFQAYVDLLEKYNNLIKRTQISLYRLLYTRITTFKALHQLYLDCCAYRYDSLGNILYFSNDDNNDLSPNNNNNNNTNLNSPHFASQNTYNSRQKNVDFSTLLQISTCVNIITEELSVLQAEQYLIPFNTTTAASNTNASSLFSPNTSTNFDKSTKSNKNTSQSLDYSNIYGISSTMGAALGISSSSTEMYILRGFISTRNLPFLKEQIHLFDDYCNDGFSLKPIINFTHTYSRDWITTPEYKRNLTPSIDSTRVGDQYGSSVGSLTMLTNSTEIANNVFEIPLEPPTIFPSLPLYLPAQELVNTYAVPSYKELNPALMTIGTFPLLFAVMFGDIVHGLMLTGVAVYLYYSMYYTPTDPVLPHDLTVNIDHPTGYQELLPHDENNVLLRHNVELYDSSSSGSGSNDGNHGKNNLYHIKVHETTSIEISTSYYSTLSSLLYQSPLYKAVAMRQGLILWFLMISLCSTYVGFIYNDAAANPLFIFNSYLQTQHNAHGGISYDKYTVYPFGLDPGWFHTKQELTFLNSFKMKMAIIIGIIHLYSGIISNIFNHIYFKHYPDLILSTLPQLLLLSCTFGYMSVLIIYKWCIDYRYYGQLFHDGKIDVLWSPVSIIQTIINMFLSPGGPIPQSMLMFSGQSQLQLLFVLISALCVPMLFIGEPLYTWFKHKKWARTYSPSILTPEEEIALNYSNRYNNNDLNDGVGGNTEVIRRLNSTQGSKNNLQSSNPSYSTFGSDDNDVDVNNINDSTDDGNGTDNDDVLHTYGNTKTKHSSTKLLISPSGRSVPSGRHSPSGLPRLPSPSSSGQNVKQFEEQHDHEVSEDDQLDPFNRHYTLSTHFVHHGIHTIEFVLGIVSNTASYLRLWALSLAHAQLSSVFWTQLITNIGLGPQSGPIGLVIAVMVWLIATVAVLLMMDFMEVALHCTRLHWVEAQSKFFRGGGYLFNPFSLHQQEEKK